jgi:MFS family permease
MRFFPTKIQDTIKRFPSQFWLILGGMLLAETGSSLIWPFMTIYIRSTLGIPLAVVASLMTITSITTLASSFITGPIIDRFGRKGMMVTGLAVVAAVFITMAYTETLVGWAVIMFLRGLFIPVYRVGADAMVADLTTPENRQEAYALVRMMGNAGIAIGPSIGGMLVSRSYDISFFSGAIAFLVFSLLIMIFAKETLPSKVSGSYQQQLPGGLSPVFRDRPFLVTMGVYTLTVMGNAVLMMLLSVYAKENFNIPERQYGFIMATNALMVVLFQYPVTSITRRYSHLPVLAAGALLYSIGIGGVAYGSTFWYFWLCMVILTIGELVMSPTITTLVANIAPPEMRGRYMSIFGLTWGVGVGIGPVIAGYFSDQYFPAAMWHVGAIFALLSVIGFIVLSLINRKSTLFRIKA